LFVEDARAVLMMDTLSIMACLVVVINMESFDAIFSTFYSPIEKCKSLLEADDTPICAGCSKEIESRQLR